MSKTAILILSTWVAHVTANSNTPFAEKIFGTWMPKKGAPTKSILGPIAYDFLASGPGKMHAGLTALRDGATGDVWFTLLNGQMWRTTGNQTQYCFGTTVLAEQSPFQVQEVTDTSVNFCWRDGDRGMPTHTKGCRGCDCARILLNLTDPDTLAFTFWMSPPVIHADLVFTRTGPAPSMKDAIHSTMLFPYQQCQIRDHYGPNLPGEPNLHNKTYQLPGGCGAAPRRVAEALMMNDDKSFGFGDASVAITNEANSVAGQCRQLNGLNFQLDNASQGTDKVMNVSDVRIQYVPPAKTKACAPCDVAYSVSAKIAADEYIGVSFKGESWEGKDPYPPEVSRPCYFGMCVDAYDNFTSDRIAVGYTANGGCVREMTTDKVIGAPTDADFKILKHTSVERVGDRTILRFTVSQTWGRGSFDGAWRVMWAIGKVASGNGCASDIGYHFNKRGVAPLEWLLTLGSTACTFNSHEHGELAEETLIV